MPDDGTAAGPVIVLAIAGALIVALVVAEVVAAVVRAVGRRTWLAENLSRRARLPLRAVLVVAGIWVALRIVTEPPPEGPAWTPGVEHALLIGVIIGVAWLIGALAFVVEDAATRRYRTDVPDNRHARRVRTQVMILRRLTVAVLVLCAIAGVLLTFDGARAAGAGVLASAGLLSVVAGLAAQTSLANVFAGLQLAFTDAIRVDDVVVVQGEWGRIEEITMTYVVVHLWDDRRLILPSTWFTTTPFENWTRRAADLLGTVELDLDWEVPVAEMRAELVRLLNESGLWDHRVGVLQVTEATGGFVRIRALASAADAPTLFDLRCEVREGLVNWLQAQHPEALPRSRWQETAPVDRSTATPGARPDALPPTPPTAPVATGVPTREDTVRLDPGKDSRLFTGSIPALERSRAFTGPGIEVIAEREQIAREMEGEPEPEPERGERRSRER
nr:mechanosensitive ion channel domain-containing protein [Actinotalea sp. JY-7876]